MAILEEPLSWRFSTELVPEPSTKYCETDGDDASACSSTSTVAALSNLMETSPHDPVVVTPTPTATVLQLQGLDGLGRAPLNNMQPVSVSGPLFNGKACMYIRGLPSSPPDLFKGSKRQSLIVIQGRFTREVPLNNLCTGQVFAKPLRNLPPAWLVNNVLLKVAHALCPSMILQTSPVTKVLMPVVSGAQCLHVAADEAQAPDLTAPPVEDCRLLEPTLSVDGSQASASAARKTFFSRRANRSGRVFSPDHVYTFYLYQHLVDLSAYKLHMVGSFDLTSHLNGQPLRFMMTNEATNETCISFDIWHRRLLT